MKRIVSIEITWKILTTRVKLETHLRDRSPLQLPKIAKGDSLFNYSVNPHRQNTSLCNCFYCFYKEKKNY